MPTVIGSLIDAVNNAASPAARDQAVNKLAVAITEAGNNGADIRALFEAAFAGPATALVIGQAQLAAIGEVQRYLANVATGAVAMTPQTVAAIVAQLVAVLKGGKGGTWQPTLPGPGNSDDPLGRLVNSGLSTLKRARELADQQLHAAEQRAKELAAAAQVATGIARDELDAAKKQAEADAKQLKDKSDQLGQAIGGALAHGWPPH